MNGAVDGDWKPGVRHAECGWVGLGFGAGWLGFMIACQKRGR